MNAALEGASRKRLPQMAGEDAEGFAVFGDGAAGDFDALLVEELGEFVVAQGLVLGLVFNEVGDGVFDAGVAEVVAGLGLHPMGEEEFHVEHAVGRGDVFASDGTADGGLVHADFLGHGGHVEGPEVVGAFLQELALVFEDLRGDAVNGLLPLVDGADEELAAADFVAHVVADLAVAGGLAEEVLVGVADAEVREIVVGHDGDPLATLALDDDVWGDVVVVADGEALGGPWVQGADEVGSAGDLLQWDAELASEDGVALVGEVVDVLVHEAPGEALLFTQALELDEEALPQVLRADADGVEALEELFGGAEVVDGDGVLEAEVVDLGVEEAAVVEVANEELDEFGDLGFDLGGMELGEEVLLERGGCHDGVHDELPALLVVAAAGGVLLAALLPVFAPFFVHLREGVDVAIIDAAVVGIVRDGVLQGGLGGLELEDGVNLDFLLDDLPQLQGRSLQYLQALLHLRPDRELLCLNLLESLVGHEWLWGSEAQPWP